MLSDRRAGGLLDDADSTFRLAISESPFENAQEWMLLRSMRASLGKRMPVRQKNQAIRVDSHLALLGHKENKWQKSTDQLREAPQTTVTTSSQRGRCFRRMQSQPFTIPLQR
jgi:hypothetical protein